MTTITISVDTDVERDFRKQAAKQHHQKKGFLGDAITEAMKAWLDHLKERQILDQAQALWLKGHHFGKLTYTKRAELHER
ncbi:MAG TPA: hypothetical protein VJH22_01245 [Candidatus Nanoarchaeia archaeon]|nr:hypothetical protein [Candidatus Nanoarchaeia archaeon]